MSNGVSAFQPPEAKNAAKTLVIMVGILLFLFLGIGVAAFIYHARPSESETILSMVTRATFGLSFPYYLTQYITLAILLVAANTSFAGFPRLLAIITQDAYAPKTFTALGDCLVYHRGIMALDIVRAPGKAVAEVVMDYLDQVDLHSSRYFMKPMPWRLSRHGLEH